MTNMMRRSTVRSLTVFLLILATASVVTVQIAPSAALNLQQSGLSLTVAPNQSSYNPGDTVSITGTLHNYGAPVPSASVSIQVSKPSGTTFFFDTPTTNGAGHFSTAFTLPQSADLGAYTVYAAYSTASVQGTFQVILLPPPPPPGYDTITVNTNPSGLDSPQGGGTYASGQQITIGISDVSGYIFIKWQRDGSDWTTQKSFQYAVDAPRTFTAIFQQTTTTTTSTTTSTSSTTSSTTTSTSSTTSSTTTSTLPSSSISLQFSPSTVDAEGAEGTTYPNHINIYGTLNPPLAGETISLSYGPSSSGPWMVIASLQTGSDGGFSYDWTPPKQTSYPQQFYLNASWAGNPQYSGAETTSLQLGPVTAVPEFGDWPTIILSLSLLLVIMTIQIRRHRRS